MDALIGYYSQQNKIWLLTPSDYGSNLMDFDTSTKQFTQHQYPFTSLKWAINGYTDINDTIYFANMEDGALKSFSMSLATYTAFTWFIPQSKTSQNHRESYNESPCITKSVTDTQHLFITGGMAGGPLSLFIIYDINTNTSIFGPDLPSSRVQHGCITASDGYLYLIGGNNGGDENSITRIDVSDINNINKKKWETSAAILSKGIVQLKVVEIGGYIYTIGGVSGGSTCINTTNYMRLSPPQIIYQGVGLQERLCLHATIVVDDQVYVFGGSKDEYYAISDWEISNKAMYKY
eukprot:493151_1